MSTFRAAIDASTVTEAPVTAASWINASLSVMLRLRATAAPTVVPSPVVTAEPSARAPALLLARLRTVSAPPEVTVIGEPLVPPSVAVAEDSATLMPIAAATEIAPLLPPPFSFVCAFGLAPVPPPVPVAPFVLRADSAPVRWDWPR